MPNRLVKQVLENRTRPLEAISADVGQVIGNHIHARLLGIEPGAELVLSRDEDVKAFVVPNNKVSYKGEVMSLSAAALKALQEMGYKSTTVSGSGYWMFDGELLDERRVRLEAQQFENQP